MLPPDPGAFAPETAREHGNKQLWLWMDARPPLPPSLSLSFSLPCVFSESLFLSERAGTRGPSVKGALCRSWKHPGDFFFFFFLSGNVLSTPQLLPQSCVGDEMRGRLGSFSFFFEQDKHLRWRNPRSSQPCLSGRRRLWAPISPRRGLFERPPGTFTGTGGQIYPNTSLKGINQHFAETKMRRTIAPWCPW